MAVIGTPVSTPSSAVDDCSTQSIATPDRQQLYGISLPTKRRALFVQQQQAATIEVPLFDRTGNPLDLGSCGDADIEVKIREVITTKTRDLYTVAGGISDADNGIIQATVPVDIRKNPGVYNLEVGVVVDDELVFSNQFFLWLNRGLFGDPKYPNAGPPSLDEVRLFIRDNAPEENRLIDEFEFDLAEICHASESAVRYWNEAQPPIGVYYSTITYAVRHKWLQYIAGHMLQVAAHRFRRNHLPYQAGGLSIDDQNKFQQYDQTGMLLIQEYKEWVKLKKVQINCMMAMTSSGSPYGSQAYHILNTGV